MIENVIIQAGGKGERAGRYAKNKPKCLISIQGKPLLFHICDEFPSAKIHLIFTKHFKSIENFLNLHPFYKNRINIIYTEYNTGDSSFLKNALGLCTGHTLICWSDILFKLPDFDCNIDTVFTTNSFSCRWKIKNGVIQQQEGDGIMGCFYVSNPHKSSQYFINDGCIIATLKDNNYKYSTVLVEKCKEFGMEDELINYYSTTSPVRNYNNLILSEDTVEKNSLNKKLIEREIKWYDDVHALGYRQMPAKINNSPFILERIRGSNVYEYLSVGGKLDLHRIFLMLDNLHGLRNFGTNKTANYNVIIDETIKRLNLVSSIHKIFEQSEIQINGKNCINYLVNLDELQDKLQKCLFDASIVSAHGDPTLSNIVIDNENNLYLIDPRGYFGDIEGPVGTRFYDFAKLYFSSVTNFDTFNKKLFSLCVSDDIKINIDSRTYCILFENEFKSKFKIDYINKLKILAATMWLRFGSCILDDYDSIVGSLAYGLYLINDSF